MEIINRCLPEGYGTFHVHSIVNCEYVFIFHSLLKISVIKNTRTGDFNGVWQYFIKETQP